MDITTKRKAAIGCNRRGNVREVKKMYELIVAHAAAIVKDATYRPKHSHHINWDATMHERGQLAWVVIYAAVFAVVIFECMTM